MANKKNDNLHKAKTAKNDEFYTTKETAENELYRYREHFKNKIIYCNCDDPYESEFFKYFMIRFELYELKGLFATSYEGSQMSMHQLQLFDDGEDYKGIPYKIQIYKDDIEELKRSSEDGLLNQQNIRTYLKKYKKAKKLKGNGSFDSPECLELLDKCDIVVTNPPFSEFRNYVGFLEEHNKQFLIIGNMNAITYKEIFPLIKDNKLWLGYTHPKEFLQPDGTKKKFGNILWYTNLDIPKRHENMILWKNYTPEEYPHYDNYDAINVDKVSYIPIDYCESWGLCQDEFDALDKTQWTEVRRETKEDKELIYVVPAEGTELRKLLHEHVDNYKGTIEQELANSIYCNGCMGVPITILDKHNPEQMEIVNANDIKNDDAIPNKLHGLIKDKEGSITQKELDKDMPLGTSLSDNTTTRQHDNTTTRQHDNALSMLESLSDRFCNGIIGVPITFLDKWSTEQFRIKGIDRYVEDNSKYGHRFCVNNKEVYARILICKVL